MEGSSPGGSRRFVRVSARDRRASEGSGRVRGACPAPGGGANAGVAREMPTFEQGLRGAGGERGGDHPDRDVNPTVHRSEPDRASRTGPKAAECGGTPGTTSRASRPTYKTVSWRASVRIPASPGRFVRRDLRVSACSTVRGVPWPVVTPEDLAPTTRRFRRHTWPGPPQIDRGRHGLRSFAQEHQRSSPELLQIIYFGRDRRKDRTPGYREAPRRPRR